MRLSLYVFVLHSVHTFVSNYPNHRSPFPDLSAMYFPPGIFPTCWILAAAKERCCQGKKYLLEHLPGARIFWGQERDKSISNGNHQQSPNIFKGCKILQFWILFRQCKVEKTEQKYICVFPISHQVDPLNTSATGDPVKQSTRVDLEAEKDLVSSNWMQFKTTFFKPSKRASGFGHIICIFRPNNTNLSAYNRLKIKSKPNPVGFKNLCRTYSSRTAPEEQLTMDGKGWKTF